MGGGVPLYHHDRRAIWVFGGYSELQVLGSNNGDPDVTDVGNDACI